MKHRPFSLSDWVSRQVDLVGAVARGLDAGGPVVGFYFAEFGDYRLAAVDGDGAAGVEDAAAGRVQGAGHLAAEQDAFPLGVDYRVGDRHRRQQRPGVGVERVGVNLVAVGNLDDVPKYITATRLLMCLTTDRSWAMKR